MYTSLTSLRHPAKICVLLIIILVSALSLPLAAQITKTETLSYKDFLENQNYLPSFDIRTLRNHSLAKTNVEQKKRALAVKTATPDNIVLRWNDQMDLPHNLHAYGLPLSADSEDDPVTIARRFALENRAVFEVTRSQLGVARVSAFATDERAGITRLVLEQRVGGIRVFDSEMMFVIDRRGRVLNQSGSFFDEASFRSSSTPALSSEHALRRASEFCKINLTSPLAIVSDKTEARERTLISSDELDSPTEVSLVYYPITKTEARLAYQVLIYSRVNIADSYLVLIDAQTGEMLRRELLTKSMQAAQGRVFTKPNPLLGDRELVTLSGDTTASPQGWIKKNRTEGNNTRVSFNPQLTGGKPIKASGQSLFDFPIDLSVGSSPLNSSKASVVNLFYWVNQCHDRFYALGFTEPWRNFQKDNFGRGGRGNDFIKAETLRGARLDPNSVMETVRNNAFFSPTLEGQSPLVAMLMWEVLINGQLARRDSSYDAGVVIHEYTHGVSIRLTGTDNSFGLINLQGGGMGEGWSDFFASSFLDNGESPLDAVTPMGTYVSGRPAGIRAFPYTTKMDLNPLTFANIRFSSGTHFQGTVWCSMLWDLRQSFIARYGFNEGRRRAEQLVIDGLKVTPAAPLFTDARDALLIANQTVNGGADADLIWRAFARRGLGSFARASAEFLEVIPAINAVESYDFPPQFTAGSFFISEKASDLTLVGETLPLTLIDRDMIGSHIVNVRARNTRTGSEVTVPLSLGIFDGRFVGELDLIAPGQGGRPQSIAALPGDVITVTYANDHNEAGAAETLEVRTTVARQVVIFEDDFDQEPFGWATFSFDADGNAMEDLWYLSQNHASSLPNSLSFAKRKNGQVFIPHSSLGFALSPSLDISNLSEPQLEFDYRFDGFPGGDTLRVGGQSQTLAAQFSIVPIQPVSSDFHSVSVSLQPLGKSRLFLTFIFVTSLGDIDRKPFEGAFIDNVRLTALSPQ